MGEICMKKLPQDKIYRKLLAALCIEAAIFVVLVIAACVYPSTYTLTGGEKEISLPFGHYFVTCNYEAVQTDATVNYLYIQDSNMTTDKIPQTENYLRDDKDSYTGEFWIYSPKKAVNFSVREIMSDDESTLVNVKSYEIRTTPFVFFVVMIPVFLIIMLTVWGMYIRRRNIVITRKSLAGAGVLFATMVISCIPMFFDKVIIGHDTLIQLLRLEGIKDGYLAGQFPVKVEPTFNAGYGYAFSTFYGSLFYNIPALFRLMGFSLQFSYKIYVALINVATVLISYYSFKVMLGNKKNAIIGSVLYSLSVYRFYDLYQRGAVGEFTAMAFLPLIAVGLWRIYTLPSDKNLRKQWVMPVIGYWGVIQSHVLSTEIYGGFTILLCLIMFKKTFKKDRFIVLLKIVLISVVLNANYLLPFLESFLLDDLYIKLGTDVGDGLMGIPLVNIFKFYTGKATHSWYIANGGLGCTSVIVIAMLVYACVKKYFSGDNRRGLWITGAISLISVIIATNIFPWRSITDFFDDRSGSSTVGKLMHAISMVFKNVQFPVRYLTVGMFVFTMFTCLVLFCKKDDRVLKAAVGIILAVTVVQFVWLSAAMMKNGTLDKRYAVSPTDKTFTFNLGGFEYMPLRDDDGLPYMNMLMDNEECQTTNAKISNYEKYMTNIKVHITTDAGSFGMVEFPLLYYRGYKAVDVNTGEKLTLHNSTSSARLSIIVPAGYDSDVRIYYAGKTSWHIAEAVSLLAMIYIIWFSAKSAKEKRRAMTAA